MRINKKAAIKRIAALSLNKDVCANFRLLEELLDRSVNGVVYDYIIKHQEEIINTIFRGDRAEYFKSYVTLVKENFIMAIGMNIRIIPWDDHILFSFKYNLNQQNKRIYRKDPLKDQVRFSEYAKDQTMNSIKDEENIKWNINWEKIKGIKIPRNFKDLLSGQISGFTYSKEKIRYLIGLISIADTNGIVQAYTVQYAHERLKDVFEDDTIALSTCYDVHNKLMKDKIISTYETSSGYNNLRISGYKEGFKKGYIAVSYFIFQERFKKLETAAIKVFFDTVFKHNNGEDKKGKIDENKPVIFKIATYLADNKDSMLKHVKVLSRLKKRSRSEILKLFSGSEKNIGLNSVFNLDLHEIRKGLIYIRVKKEYFIKKSEAVKASFFYAEDRFKRKANIIKDAIENTLIKLSRKQFNVIVGNLFKASKRAINAIIKTVNKELQEGNRINDIAAYIIAVYNRYKKGERIKLIIKDLNISIIDKLSDPYEYIWMSNN